MTLPCSQLRSFWILNPFQRIHALRMVSEWWRLVSVANDRDPWYNPIHPSICWFKKWLEHLLQAPDWRLPPCFMEACEVRRGPGLCLSLFFFGEKVDEAVSLFLLRALSLSAWRDGCLRPWRVAPTTSVSEALCSFSVFTSTDSWGSSFCGDDHIPLAWLRNLAFLQWVHV